MTPMTPTDRKSTRLNSSHVAISYAVFCLKKKIAPFARDVTSAQAKGDIVEHRCPGQQCKVLKDERPISAGPFNGLSAHRLFFFFNHTPPTKIYTLSLHDALPI